MRLIEVNQNARVGISVNVSETDGQKACVYWLQCMFCFAQFWQAVKVNVIDVAVSMASKSYRIFPLCINLTKMKPLCQSLRDTHTYAVTKRRSNYTHSPNSLRNGPTQVLRIFL